MLRSDYLTRWLTAYRDNESDITDGRIVITPVMYNSWRIGPGAVEESVGVYHRRLCPRHQPVERCGCRIWHLFVHLFGVDITDESRFYSVEQIVGRARRVLGLKWLGKGTVNLPKIPRLVDLCLVRVSAGAIHITELADRKNELVANVCAKCSRLKYGDHNVTCKK